MAVLAGAAATASGGGATGSGRANTYFADMIPRAPNGDAATDAQRAEINRILQADLAAGKISGEDRLYLSQMIANRTGLSPAEAEQRVDLIYAQAKQAADETKAKAMAAADDARKAAAHSALWMFVALLLGAFVAAISAIAGGRHRDHSRVII